MDVVSHSSIAEWLRPEIRDSIAATAPCTASSGHDWDHDRVALYGGQQVAPVGIREFWQCRGCGAVVHTDPATF